MDEKTEYIEEVRRKIAAADAEVSDARVFAETADNLAAQKLEELRDAQKSATAAHAVLTARHDARDKLLAELYEAWRDKTTPPN
jgi:hypothetical protein